MNICKKIEMHLHFTQFNFYFKMKTHRNKDMTIFQNWKEDLISSSAFHTKIGKEKDGYIRHVNYTSNVNSAVSQCNYDTFKLFWYLIIRTVHNVWVCMIPFSFTQWLNRTTNSCKYTTGERLRESEHGIDQWRWWLQMFSIVSDHPCGILPHDGAGKATPPPHLGKRASHREPSKK